MRDTCPRRPEAEALRDGRLDESARASFTRHAAECPVCQREIASLEALAERLRASSDHAALADELLVARQRARLLAAFGSSVSSAKSAGPSHAPRPAPRRAWAALSATLLAAAVLLVVKTRPHVEVAPLARAAVHAGAGAAWSRREEGARETLTLERGELWIHVEHERRGLALRVKLPDGELDDVGTTFTVVVEDGHTARVAVEEGEVILRLRDRPVVRLGRGATWQEPGAQRPASTAAAQGLADRAQDHERTPPATSSSSSSSSSTRSPARRSLHRVGLAMAPAASRVPPPETHDASAPDEAAEQFRAALALLDAGAHREAATALARFLAAHPRDARAEDAAYLRIIALQRGGASDELKAAARQYLRLFPRGFRRVEAESLAR